jgi:hypothetical protein
VAETQVSIGRVKRDISDLVNRRQLFITILCLPGLCPLSDYRDGNGLLQLPRDRHGHVTGPAGRSWPAGPDSARVGSLLSELTARGF